MDIPGSLRAWFVLHSVTDLVCGIPLLLFPEAILPRLGWVSVDPVSARLVGASLLALGVQSWRMRRAGVPEYRVLLGLKVIWSASAILGLTIAIARGAPSVTFLLLATYLMFCGVWTHHAIRIRQLAETMPATESDDPDTVEEAPPAPHA